MRCKQLRYADFRRQGLPIGSGVTAAACQTVSTQRLKRSGMRWTKPGARPILALRVIRLSGVWQEVYAKTLEVVSEVQVRTPEPFTSSDGEIAA